MRVPVVLFMIGLAAPVIGAVPPTSQAKSPAAIGQHCQRPTSYLAGETGAYRGPPLAPQKLTELPPARMVMAVDRRVDGCEYPLIKAGHRFPPK